MDPLKPGYQTSEFWLTLVAKAIVLLVSFGVITADKGHDLQAQLTNLVMGVFAVIALWRMARAYLDARMDLKTRQLDGREHPSNDGDNPPPGGAAAVSSRPDIRVSAALLLAVLGLGLFAMPAPAQVLPWRQSCNRRLHQLEQRQQPPAPAPAPAPQTDPGLVAALQQIAANQQMMLQMMQQRQAQPQAVPAPAPAPQMYLIPAAPIQLQPQQVLPISPPQQQLPIAPPQQQLPVAPPQQALPIAPPQQQLPIAGPQQVLPTPGGTAPQQRLPAPSPQAPPQPAAPPATPPPQVMPPAGPPTPTGPPVPQRYSAVRR